MLVVVQIPIVDLRGFATTADRLPLPGWPAPDPDKDFLRSFGAVRRRPSGGINGWLGEAAVCEVDRGVRFAGPIPRIISADGGDWTVRVAYRRFFADGVAMGKFEVGFDVRPARKADNHLLVDAVVEALLRLPVHIGGTAPRSLGAAGATFAKAYAKSTTRHGVDPDTTSRFVLAGRPTAVIEHNGRTLWIPRRARELPGEQLDAPTVSFWHQRLFETDIPVWFLPRSRLARSGPTRELRLYLCRFHADTEAIAKTLRSVSMGIITPEPRSPYSDRLQQFLLDSFRHQRQLGLKLDAKTRLPFYEEALWHRDHALPGYYDGLLARISAINPRPAVKSTIDAYVAARRSQDDQATVVILGDYVVTQNNVENSGIIGVVGDVSNSTVTANQTTLGGASKTAIAELEALATILAQRASTPDEEVGAAAVKNAAERLSKGDEPGALAWLKRSGAWALKVAEDVSVKLAAELIIRAST